MRISLSKLWHYAGSHEKRTGDIIESFMCIKCYSTITNNIFVNSAFTEDLPRVCPYCTDEKIGIFDADSIYIWEDKLNDCIRL